MRVLAIDPGYERVGVAVIEKNNNTEILVFSECFKTSPELDFNKRLCLIGQHIHFLIKEYDINMFAIEGLFFSKNTKTALKVSEARGVIIFQAVNNNIPVFEYTPNQIKVAIAGHGKANKKNVSLMVSKLINLDTKKRIDDEIDAIAIGLTFFAIYRKPLN